jgi:hypothetical protein
MRSWKFVLTNEKTGESQDLEAEFKADANIRDAEEGGYCDVQSSDAAHYEALERLGYRLTIVEGVSTAKPLVYEEKTYKYEIKYNKDKIYKYEVKYNALDGYRKSEGLDT